MAVPRRSLKNSMACISRSAATLRIIGDDLVPDEITRLLGATPTQAQTKGDKIVGKKTGKVRIARFGMWRLQALDCEPEDLDGQISFIFNQLTKDLTVWGSFSSKYKIDLFCGLFMECSNEGMELSPESLSVLGSRGIKIGLDVYGPLPDDKETTSEQVIADYPKRSLKEMPQEDYLIITHVPSLVATLLNKEKAKGKPLTQNEVESIRDNAPAVAMTQEQRASVDKGREYLDIDPENVWREWQLAKVELIE